jgi:hypothetical protein
MAINNDKNVPLLGGPKEARQLDLLFPKDRSVRYAALDEQFAHKPDKSVQLGASSYRTPASLVTLPAPRTLPAVLSLTGFPEMPDRCRQPLPEVLHFRAIPT